jgi:hypothetical protein
MKEEVLSVPSNLKGLIGLKSKNKDSYSFKVKHKFFKDGYIIPIEKKDNHTLKNTMSLLMYAYKKSNIKIFESLFMKKDKNKVDFSSVAVKNQFNAFSNLRKPYIRFILQFKGGFYVSYGDQLLENNRAVFFKKNKGKFYIEPLHLKKTEGLLNNYTMFQRYSSFKTTKIKKNSYEEKRLKLLLSKKKNYLYVIDGKKDSFLFYVQDNVYRDKFKDVDLEYKSVEVSFKSLDLKNDFYILETSYPMSYLLPKQKKLLTKVKLK